MAKERMINTKFWDDNYIVTLDPIEKLLYLYFLTNSLTNICGIYEIQLRRVAYDTGIDKDMVQKVLDRFSKDNKIHFIDGWLAIKNFTKHQKDNPKVKKGIEIGLESVPKVILEKLKIDYDRLSHSNSNSNPKIELPIWLNKEKWNEWVKYLTEKKKKKPTESTLKLHIKKLSKNITGHIGMIDKAIECGWSSVFLPDVTTPFKSRKPSVYQEPNTSKEDNERSRFLADQAKKLSEKIKI